jgi:hydrogenase maturation protease
MSEALIVGVGQPYAGDDGVGREVVRRLRNQGIAAEEASDGAGLLALLDGVDASRVIVVDAAVGAGPPGDVLVLLDPDDLPPPRHPVSSHGLSVPEALALARVLGCSVPVHVVAIAIAPAAPMAGEGLTPCVAAAVDSAATLVRALAAAIVFE